MPNPWGALGLSGDMGGFGRVDIRGATPPLGKTGTGGMEGVGLMALLRRLSMGLDDRGPEKLLPDPASPDPAATGNSLSGADLEAAGLGQADPGMRSVDPSMMGMPSGGDDMMGQMPPVPPGGVAMGQPGMDPGFPQMQPTGTSMSPDQQRIAYEEEMRRLGMPGF